MKTQATRCTRKQLAYLAYWQALGYTFGRDDQIPEDTSIKPRQWHLPRSVDLAVTALALAVICAALYFKN